MYYQLNWKRTIVYCKKLDTVAQYFACLFSFQLWKLHCYGLLFILYIFHLQTTRKFMFVDSCNFNFQPMLLNSPCQLLPLLDLYWIQSCSVGSWFLFHLSRLATSVKTFTFKWIPDTLIKPQLSYPKHIE